MNSLESYRDISVKEEQPEDHSHLDILEISPKLEQIPDRLQEELEPPHIKDEEEGLLIRPEEPAGSTMTLLAVKSEGGDEDIYSHSSEAEIEVELESESASEAESEIEFQSESDTEVTENSDDEWDETGGGQSASNTSSITRNNQGDAEESRSHSHLNGAQSVQKNILHINTPCQMQAASVNGPINVIYANALNSSNVPVINIPLVLTYNGYQHGRFNRSGECQQVTIMSYKQQQLQIQTKTDVPTVSLHQSSRKVCKRCRKRFLHLNKHLSKSPLCRSYYDTIVLKNNLDKHATYRQRQLQKCQSEHNEAILRLCNNCHNHFRHLNMHLSKSSPCKLYYDKRSLQTNVDKPT